MSLEPTVFIVDDDQAVRDAIGLLMKSVGIKSQAFRSGDDFLQHCGPEQPGCLILDVRMPGTGGLKLHEQLLEQNWTLPIIFITGHGDIPMATRALKRGAVDFLTKPFNDQDLLDRIYQAFQLDTQRREERHIQTDIRQCLESLTSVSVK